MTRATISAMFSGDEESDNEMKISQSQKKSQSISYSNVSNSNRSSRSNTGIDKSERLLRNHQISNIMDIDVLDNDDIIDSSQVIDIENEEEEESGAVENEEEGSEFETSSKRVNKKRKINDSKSLKIDDFDSFRFGGKIKNKPEKELEWQSVRPLKLKQNLAKLSKSKAGKPIKKATLSSSRIRSKVSYAENSEEEDEESSEEESESDDSVIEVRTTKSIKKSKSVESEDDSESEEEESDDESETINNESDDDDVEIVETKSISKSKKKLELDKILGRKKVTAGNKMEDHYLIKWKGVSYQKVEWVPSPVLISKYEARTRVNNFLKRELREKELAEINHPGEYFNSNYCKIDRIISHREFKRSSSINDLADGDFSFGNFEFLVVWKSLPYTESTWEIITSVEEKDKIDKYFSRNQSPSLKNNSSNFHDVESVLNMKFKNNNELRPYQIEGLKWLAFNYSERRSVILADEMGLGKTVQTVTFLNWISKSNRGPFLVVAPLSTLGHWIREIETWTDMNGVVYIGDAINRDLIKEHEFYYGNSFNKKAPVYKFNILITTPEILMKDSAFLSSIKWAVLLCDEAQRLKNMNSSFFQILYYDFDYRHTVLMSGTPLQNSVDELWTLMHFIDRESFPSLESFKESYGNMNDSTQVAQLQSEIKPYILRRLKGDVEKNIPGKEETLIEVELTSLQKKYYKAIYEKNATLLSAMSSTKNVPSLMNVAMQLRKCCNHPFTLEGVEFTESIYFNNDALIESCGKLVLLDKLLPKLKSQGHKVLIFSQMVKVLDILEDFIRYRGWGMERIDGAVKGSDRQTSIDRFSKKDSDKFIFLLCTRAGGVGINLTAADTVIIYDSDWNPQNDIQAMARCHRIGQTKPVKIYRLITRNTYEAHMFHKSSMKLGLDRAVLHSMSVRASNEGESKKQSMTPEEIEKLLKHGAYAVFTEDDDKSAQFQNDDIDKILSRAVAIKHDDDTSDAQNSFSKASYVAKSADTDIQLDDPDFWKKLGINNHAKHSSELQHRSRTQISKFTSQSAIKNSSESGSGSDFSAEELDENDGEEKFTNSIFTNAIFRDSVLKDISLSGCYNLEYISQDLIDLTGKTKEQLIKFVLGYISLLKKLNTGTSTGDGLIHSLKPLIAAQSGMIEAEEVNILELLSSVPIDESLTSITFTEKLSKSAKLKLENLERMFALQRFWDINKSFESIEFTPFQNLPDWLFDNDKTILMHAKNNGLHSINNSFCTKVLNYTGDTVPSCARIITRFNLLTKPMVDIIYKLHDIQISKPKRAAKSSDKPLTLTKVIKKSIQQSLLAFKAPANDAEMLHISNTLKMDMYKYDPVLVKEYYSLLLAEIEKTVLAKSENSNSTELTQTTALRISSRQKLLTRICKLVNSDNFKVKRETSILQTEEKSQKRFVPPEDYDLLFGIASYGFGAASFKLMQEDVELQLFKRNDALPKDSLMEVRASSIVYDIIREIENGSKLKSIEKPKSKPLSLVPADTLKKVKKLLEFDVINLDNDFETSAAPKLKVKTAASIHNLDENGKVKLPMTLLSGITIHSFGKLASLSIQDGLHIYPIGFKSSRIAPSYITPDQNVTYFSEVKNSSDGNGKKLSFSVLASDDKISTYASSHSDAWHIVISRIHEAQEFRNMEKNVNFKSTDGFGFSDNYVNSTILNMKSNDKPNPIPATSPKPSYIG